MPVQIVVMYAGYTGDDVCTGDTGDDEADGNRMSATSKVPKRSSSSSRLSSASSKPSAAAAAAAGESYAGLSSHVLSVHKNQLAVMSLHTET